jgi:hypothetical protein
MSHHHHVTKSDEESTREEQDLSDPIMSDVLKMFSSEVDEYDIYQACEDN